MAVYLVCYIISFILARQHFYMLSGLVLITAALWLYIKDYRETGNLIHLRGLFCLFFVGGQGISCFKLSRLQTDWSTQTWVCLGLAVFTFWIVFEVLHRIYDGWSAADMQSVYRFYASAESPLQAKRLLHSMAALVVLNIPLLYFLNKDWYAALMTTVPGKAVLAVCAAAIFLSFARVVKLTQPIEYRR